MARKSAEYWAQQGEKANTKNQAMAWGRIAARLGWSLDSLALEVAEEFHDIALQAYHKRLGA